jgi:PAS domain S-box-containing protein
MHSLEGDRHSAQIISQDITERKMAERESIILKTAIDQVPVGIAIADEKMQIYYCNPEGLGMRGGDIDDLVEIPKEIFNHWQVYTLDGEKYEVDNLPLVRAIRNGEIIREEFIVKHEDNTDHFCDAVACPVFENKKIIGGLIIFLDITMRKNVERSLTKNESLFRGLYNHMTSGSAIYEVMNDGSKGSDYIVKNFNRKSLEIEGKTLEQVVGKSLYDLRPTIDEYGLIPVMKKVWETGEPAYFPIKIYQDDIFSNFYENYIFKIPTGEVVTIYNDVTDQKNSEIALKESEERFAIAMDFANDGLFDWNLETNDIYYSPAWKRLLGYEDEELQNDFSVWETLTAPQDVKRSWTMQNELINKKRDKFEIEFKMRHKDGHWVDILSRANAIFNENGTAVRIVGTHVDISERKKTEVALQESEQKYRHLIQTASDAIYLISETGRFFDVNTAACNMLDRSREEILNLDISGIDPNFSVETFFEFWKETPLSDPRIFETTHLHKDGSLVPVEVSGQKFQVGEDVLFFGIARNISDRKKAEVERAELQAKLIQSQRMESIGTLAGGIAHEFNNILSIIIGNNELIMEDLPEWSLSRESCEEIRLAGLRARDIVKHLLTFSRHDDSSKKPVNIRSVVKESLKLIRSTTPTNIEIKNDLSLNCFPVLGDVTQINQVLINLVNNSVYALPISGGRIDVELSNTVIDDRTGPLAKKLAPGKYVCLQVKDNGSGMDKEVLDRIFEPYFTTKDVDQGSGLGLSVVHGIVENHNGLITCDSSKGQGTTFTILIPAHDGPVISESEQKISLSGRGECILYIDDEPSVAKLGKRHLKALGYEPVAITDPVEALEMIKAEPDRFDLIISDMAMPNLPGDQLITEILSVKPSMPTIICTGYSSRMTEAKALEMGVKGFVMKPLNKNDLAKTVRKVLDEAKG